MTINFSMILVILMVKNIKEFNNFCFQMSKTIQKVFPKTVFENYYLKFYITKDYLGF